MGAEEAAVDLFVIMNYGVGIHDVAKAVQENVKKSIESMTGLRVVEVNVRVQGILIEKEKPADAEALEEPKAPRVK